MEYFRQQVEERQGSKGNYNNWQGAFKHFEHYAGSSLTFRDLDKKLCKGFKEYLEKDARKSTGQELTQNSVISYFNKFRACLKQAVKDGILEKNPASDIVMGKGEEVEREFLDNDELEALVKTPCQYPMLKNAFLFSCLTGLRWSDIHKLKWKEPQERDGKWYVVFHQQKTKGLQYHPIKKSARDILGEAGESEEKVFKGLHYATYMNVALKQWVMKAEISKNITFHCARHAFAVLFLKNGGDIYTLKE